MCRKKDTTRDIENERRFSKTVRSPFCRLRITSHTANVFSKVSTLIIRTNERKKVKLSLENKLTSEITCQHSINYQFLPPTCFMILENEISLRTRQDIYEEKRLVNWHLPVSSQVENINLTRRT